MDRVAAFPRRPGAPRHALNGELIVSLTSYPPRFPTLALTLKSLLDQTIRPDSTILWIAEADFPLLPPEVHDLAAHGLTIRTCDDLGSFKKILPALEAHPQAFIAIADDDSFYPHNWLADLVGAFDPQEPSIVGRRVHQLTYDAHGRLAPYARWRIDTSRSATSRPREDLLPTGNGGVLYPPGSFSPDVMDDRLRRLLSPTCDDTWLYFHARRAGMRIRRVPGLRLPLIEWANTQDVALRKFHRGARRNAILEAMTEQFGTP